MNKNIQGIGMPVVIILIALLALIGGGIYMMSKQTPPVEQQKVKEAGLVENKEAPTATSGAVVETEEIEPLEITIIEKNFSIEPKEINVKKGQKVIVTLNNNEGTHNFVINEFNVASRSIDSGESTTFEFTPDKAGTFDFYCGVGAHRQLGMVGSLLVE